LPDPVYVHVDHENPRGGRLEYDLLRVATMARPRSEDEKRF